MRKAVDLAQAGLNIYQASQNAQTARIRHEIDESNEAWRKQSEERDRQELVRRYGSLEMAQLARDEYERIWSLSERYNTTIPQHTGRIALVTNFSRNYDAAQIGQKAVTTLTGNAINPDSVDMFVVEPLIHPRYQSRLHEFNASADVIAENLRLETDKPVVRFQHVTPVGLTESTLLDRAEHADRAYPKYLVGYIGVGSTLELNGVGVPVEFGFLGACGEVYAAHVNGKVLVPGTENPETWARPDL